MYLNLLLFPILPYGLLNYEQDNTTEYDGSYITDIIRYPYQVSVRMTYNKNDHLCGGSIISNRHILTAGHCVYQKVASSVIIVAGTSFVHLGGERYNVERIILHEDFSGTTDMGFSPTDISAQNDIALLLTATEINFNLRVQPILLQYKDVGVGITGTATGWGTVRGMLFPNATIQEKVEMGLLKEIPLTTISLLDCFNRLGEDTQERLQVTHICTLMTKGVGICRTGVSGGPFVVDGKLTGIATHCVGSVPDMFTSVAAFKPWIESKMVESFTL